MSFGLKNASATFQRVMNQNLAPHKSHAGAYVDDTGVASPTFPQHLIHLDGVLQSIEDVGMTLKLSKCKFAMATAKFVGHVVGSGRKEMDMSRVDAILSMSPPDTKKKWRSFVGLVNYYRDYMPSMSTLLLPLTDLTKKDAPEKSINTDAVLQAFDALKQALSSPAMLHAVRYDRDFVLQTDASDCGWGVSFAAGRWGSGASRCVRFVQVFRHSASLEHY